MSEHATRGPRPSTTTVLVGLAVLGALAAFLAGQWAGGRPGPSRSPASAAAAQRRQALAAAVPPWTGRRVETESLATAAARAQAQPPTTSATRATPELVARATAETTSVLEASRAELDARCWPKAGLASGAASTVVTFNVTYDAAGREIARGLAEDRQARAPELVRCLQRLPLGSLRITPTGANVGVKVALRLP